MASKKNTYVILLRGINVGGKNKVSMAELKLLLEELGCVKVTTYINSGNAIAQSSLNAQSISRKIEKSLPARFKLDSSLIKVLALTNEQFRRVVEKKPQGFG